MIVLPELAAFDRLQLPFKPAFRRCLHVEIERGVNIESFGVQLAAELSIQLLPHPLDEIGCRLTGLDLGCETQRIRLRKARISFRNRAVLTHQLDDGIAALYGAIRITARIVPLWRLWKRSKRSSFGDVEIAHRLPEVPLRRGFDAVCAVAEIDLIQVEFENLGFAVLVLDLACDLRFLDLANDRLVARDAFREDVTSELHRDGRETLCVATALDVVNKRSSDAIPIDSRMLVEPFVLGDDKRVLFDLGNLAQIDKCSPFRPQLRDESPIHGEEFGGLLGRVLIQRLNRWTAIAIADKYPCAVQQPDAKSHHKYGDNENCAKSSRVALPERKRLCLLVSTGHSMNLRRRVRSAGTQTIYITRDVRIRFPVRTRLARHAGATNRRCREDAFGGAGLRLRWLRPDRRLAARRESCPDHGAGPPAAPWPSPMRPGWRRYRHDRRPQRKDG